MNDKTSVYDATELKEGLILLELNEVATILKDSGYNNVNQLVGYILTGDDCYITSDKGARDKISKYNKNEVLSALLKDFLEK